MKTSAFFTLFSCMFSMALSGMAAVTNITHGGAAHATIQGAVDAAVGGDTLLVSVGQYGEQVAINQKSLLLKGGYLADFVTRTNLPALTCINAGYSGPAMTITSNCTVVLEYLMLTNGAALAGGGISMWEGVVLTAQHCVVAQNIAWGGGGAAIGAASALVLYDSSVASNVALGGGGLFVESNAVVVLNGSARISHNSADGYGGGALVGGTLIGDSWLAQIDNNTAGNNGGGVAVDGGTLDLHPTHVHDNTATNSPGRGGGICVYHGGRATVSASGNVYKNRACDGAGIYADHAQVELPRAVLHGNCASNNGGAVCLLNSSLAADNTMIGEDLAGRTNYAAYGGGIYALTSTVVFSGEMYNNHARISGAGIYARASTVTVYNAQLGGTANYQANQLGPDGHTGAGLYLAGTLAVISNTVIASNIFQTAGFAYGGGIYAANNSDVTLLDSRIEYHHAPSTLDGLGAGLYARESVVALYNSQIVSNIAGSAAGGVRLWEEGTFVLSNSVVACNHALSGAGGGIACGGPFKLAITDSTLRNNSAATDGGAIYLSQGTQTFAGGWTLRENMAGRNGGAVAITGSAGSHFYAHAYCFVYYNRATNGHGGMLYLDHTATVYLHATAGQQMYIYANHASGNGGALYARNGGYCDVYGMVNFNRNRARNGGAIYLSNGARLWLDDYVNDRPALWDNFADNGSGGAIYAADSPNVRLTVPVMGREGTGNYASALGGAMAAFSSTVLIQRATAFYDNTARTGGALALSNSLVTLDAGQQQAPLFVRNMSVGTSATDGGGAIYAEHGTHLIAQNTIFTDNTSSNNGGGIWLRNATAELTTNFAVFPGSVIPPTLFSNNIAHAGYGGAIELSDGSAATLANALCVDNRASVGGSIRIGASTADLVNVVLYRNSAGVRAMSGHVLARHCTIINNSAQGIDGGASACVSNCIVRGQTISIVAGKQVNYSNIEGGYATGTGNIDADAAFVNQTGYNFALTHLSPCVDAGANLGITNDCIGALRPMNSGYDMGAYEMNPAPLQSVSPTVLDFGDVVAGDSATLPLQVANTGNSALTGTVMYVPAPTFTFVPDAYIVPPLDTANLTATFAPPVEFVWSQTVVFASNGGTQDVVLIGTGIPEPGSAALSIMLMLAFGRMRRYAILAC